MIDTKLELNQNIFNGDKLKSDVRNRLLKIAMDFYKSLKLENETKGEDIWLTGSLATYSWTSYSDLDLHILLDYDKIDMDEETLRKLFQKTKNNWNQKHDIEIAGHEVEIYLQDIDELHTAGGIYSVLNDEWIKDCLLYTSPSPRDRTRSRMPSSA